MHHGGGLGRLVDHLRATALPAANLSQSKAASIDAAFLCLDFTLGLRRVYDIHHHFAFGSPFCNISERVFGRLQWKHAINHGANHAPID